MVLKNTLAFGCRSQIRFARREMFRLAARYAKADAITNHNAYRAFNFQHQRFRKLKT